MKKIAVIILVVLMAAAMIFGCSSSKSGSSLSGKEVVFEYNAYTLGSSVNYVVTKDLKKQKEVLQGEVTNYKNPVDTDEWDDLLIATEKVDLEKLAGIEVPSTNYQSDGAMAATLKITIDGKTYQSPTFDHDNPPAAIKEIINDIIIL
jgi:uncharacterized lipoprotein YajG